MFDPSTVGFAERPDYTVALTEIRFRDGDGMRGLSVVEMDHDRGDRQDWHAVAWAAAQFTIPPTVEVRSLRCASVPVDDRIDHRVLLMWLSDPDLERTLISDDRRGGCAVPWDAALAAVVSAVASAAREAGAETHATWQTGFLFPTHTEAFRAAMRRPDG